jgi:glycosyltransferase involved in cell wall biosynthesis
MKTGSQKKQSISVALCTYNGEKFLDEQLRSIAAQTVLPNELVVSDDGSTDTTLSILRNFASAAPFAIRILETEVNLGSTKNFEHAIAHCGGTIVALADQDDIWQPNKLEQLRTALDTDSQAGFVLSDSELIDTNGQSLHVRAWEWHRFRWATYNQETARSQLRRLLRGSFVTGATMAIRSELFPIVRPFAPEWYHDVWIAMTANAFGWRGVALPETLIKYRQHRTQQIGGRPRIDVIGSAKRWLSNETTGRKELATACEKQAIGFDRLIHKLQKSPASEDHSELIALLRRAAEHQRQRSAIFDSDRFRRSRLVMQELLNRNYQNFSESAWRACRDLFL